MMVDVKTRKVGCVIIQSAFGCSAANGFLQMHFDNWETSPTPDMRRVTGTKEQWLAYAAGKLHIKERNT